MHNLLVLSKTSKAVGLPEVVESIMEVIVDAKTLVTSTRVCKLWANKALARLWRLKSDIDALLALDPPGRLQYCAEDIVSLGM